MAKQHNKELEEKLLEVGRKLASPSSDLEELRSLLDQTECFLSRVEQSPTESMYDAFRPVMEVLVSKQHLNHSEMDLKVAVTSCLTEITRITAPHTPYCDDLMKVIFQMIVATFEKLDDISSRQYSKRLSILLTVAKVRSSVIMLDLECNALVLEMFEHFLKVIRPEHSLSIFYAMESIMSLVLEESEDILSELLSCLLKSVTKNNKDVLPIARRLGEKVISNCAVEIKPYLLETIQSIGSLNDFSSAITSIVDEDLYKRQNEVNSSTEGLESEKLEAEGICSEETGSAAVKSSALMMGNGTVPIGKSTFVVEPTSPEQKSERSCRSIESKSATTTSRAEPDILCSSMCLTLESPPDHTVEKTMGQESNKEIKENAAGGQTCARGVSSVKEAGGVNNLEVKAFEQTGRKGLTRNIMQRDFLAKVENTKSKQQKGNIAVEEDVNRRPTSKEEVSSLNSQKTPKKGHCDLDESSKAKTGRKRVRRTKLEEVSSLNSQKAPKKGQCNLDESSKEKSGRKCVRRTELIYGEQTQENIMGQNLVNSRILVWWPEDKKFYSGTVASYDQLTERHKIVYDDDDVEILFLKEEIWKFYVDYNDTSWGQAKYIPNPNAPPEKRAEVVNLRPNIDSASELIRETETTEVKFAEEIQRNTNTILPQKRPLIENMVVGNINEPKTAWDTENDLKKVNASEGSISFSWKKESASKEEIIGRMCISNSPVFQDSLPDSALEQPDKPGDSQEEVADVSSTISNVSNILEKATEEQHPKEAAASEQTIIIDEDIEDLKVIEAEKQLKRKNQKRHESVMRVAVTPPLPPKISSCDEVDVVFSEHIFDSDFLKKIRIFSQIIQNRWYQINPEPLITYFELADEFGRSAAFDHGNLFNTIRQRPHYQGFDALEPGMLEDLWYEMPLVFEGLHKSFENQFYFQKNAETIRGWIDKLGKAGFDISVPLAAFELLTVSPTTFKKFRERLQSVSFQLVEEKKNVEILKSELPVSRRLSEIDSMIDALKKQRQDLESEMKLLEPLKVMELELEKYGTSLKACRLQKLKNLYEKEIADAENFIREVSLDSFFKYMNQLQ